MQRIVCRFDDAETFLEHFEGTGLDDPGEPTLTFVSEQGLPRNEVLRVTFVIADSGEHHNLHVHIDDRTPTLSGESAEVRWRYTARIAAEDVPWLEMLVAKLTTARHITRTA